MIMWLIGLSGAGKSTLAEAVAAEARKTASNVVLVDGDVMREVWGDSLGHDLAGRRKNADRLCRFCAYLEGQGIHAVCPILSLFPESREWNRRHLKRYYEVYIKAPLPDLIARDGKGLYRRALNNETELPGVNLNFPEPERPDEAIVNNSTRDTLLDHAPRLASVLLSQND